MNNGYWTLWKWLRGRIFKPEDFSFKKSEIWGCKKTSRGPKKRSASESWLRDRLGQRDSFESFRWAVGSDGAEFFPGLFLSVTPFLCPIRRGGKGNGQGS